ncbi:MAG TPA: alpha/beta hydrolase [Gemmatimonas sp.]|nr:alpha/beta hydrolase [Gemmatimonas sp.]
MQHHKAFCNGQILHYVRAGTGDPVVLLHGWPATWYHWRKLIPLLADTYTVIAPDLRGFGDSTKPASGYDTRTITEDVYQLVQQLGLSRPFIVGHDMGAVHAYTYANRHPDEVRGLAYLDEPLPGFGYEQFAQLQPDPAMQGGFFFAHFHLAPDLPEALVAGRERLYLSYLIRRMSYDPSAFDEADLDEYERTFGGGGFRGSIGVYREIGETIRQNREAATTKLQLPVLALGGAFGVGELTLRDMRAVAADVRGAVIPECGHFIAEERPAELARALRDFFGSVG